MKYVVVVFIVALGIFLNGVGIRSPRMPFTHSEPVVTIEGDGVNEGGCTEKFIRTYGFPFRVNTYDVCEQEESTHSVAIIVNLVIWVMASYLTFRHTSALNTKKT